MSDYINKVKPTAMEMIVGIIWLIGIAAAFLFFSTSVTATFGLMGVSVPMLLKYSGYTALSCIGVFALYCLCVEWNKC